MVVTGTRAAHECVDRVSRGCVHEFSSHAHQVRLRVDPYESYFGIVCFVACIRRKGIQTSERKGLTGRGGKFDRISYEIEAINQQLVSFDSSFYCVRRSNSSNQISFTTVVNKFNQHSQSEFVRMAAMFGAKIIPFGVVGEDDIGELIFDYEDQMKIPYLRQFIHELTDEVVQLRSNVEGEVANQDVHFPVMRPKLPGRFYYVFGNPIETKGDNRS
ncbi:unnamed protein product [Lactuca virosa]|uniref:Uncharacterized protein n=1 Tax=Lactuca virosa TaxID=75947 RepID=A0AAU9P3X9_9ASTR|nr:unnamed protein product [Lactuca virosa]